MSMAIPENARPRFPLLWRSVFFVILAAASFLAGYLTSPRG